jgi:hypothetical protein
MSNHIYHWGYIADGSTVPMNVDGSSTAVEYTWEPTGDEHVLKDIGFVLETSSAMVWNKFGNITKLSNGLKIEMKSDGTYYEIANIKMNSCLRLAFPESHQVGDSTFYGQMLLGQQDVFLKTDTSDEIRVTIRDDLSGLTDFRMSVYSFMGV